MPKKSEKKSAIDMVGWIDRLPEGGGEWGKTIVSAIISFESEADAVDVEVEKLSTQMAALKEKAAARRSMALQAARRADREAAKLFTSEEIQAAKPAAAATDAGAGTAS